MYRMNNVIEITTTIYCVCVSSCVISQLLYVKVLAHLYTTTRMMISNTYANCLFDHESEINTKIGIHRGQ
jgi:hypothetical protein